MERKTTRGFLAQLALAAGCQRPYLSQVLRSHVHLTPEHACGLAQFLGLDELETEYFLALVDLGRAGTQKLQTHLRKKLETLRKKSIDLAQRIKRPEIENIEAQAKYYSSWHLGAIRIIVNIPEYQTPETISRRLNLPIPVVFEALRQLKMMGFVCEKGGRWMIEGPDLHISKTSPLNPMNHQNWRARAVLDSYNSDNDSVHYTATFCVGREDIPRLRAELLEFMDKQRESMRRAPNEELICFTCDFFTP